MSAHTLMVLRKRATEATDRYERSQLWHAHTLAVLDRQIDNARKNAIGNISAQSRTWWQTEVVRLLQEREWVHPPEQRPVWSPPDYKNFWRNVGVVAWSVALALIVVRVCWILAHHA